MADSVYIVFKGKPEQYSNLDRAEERAAELCEDNQLDYTVMSVPVDCVIEKSLVYRYIGVQMMTLQEAN